MSEVKPWDFYFGTTMAPPKFSEFLEETLLPAYCVGVGTNVDEDMQRKIRFAAEKWYESCEVDDGRGLEKAREMGVALESSLFPKPIQKSYF